MNSRKRDNRGRLVCGGGHHSKKKYLSSGSFTNVYPGCCYETTGFRIARLRSPLERMADAGKEVSNDHQA